MCGNNRWHRFNPLNPRTPIKGAALASRNLFQTCQLSPALRRSPSQGRVTITVMRWSGQTGEWTTNMLLCTDYLLFFPCARLSGKRLHDCCSTLGGCFPLHRPLHWRFLPGRGFPWNRLPGSSPFLWWLISNCFTAADFFCVLAYIAFPRGPRGPYGWWSSFNVLNSSFSVMTGIIWLTSTSIIKFIDIQLYKKIFKPQCRASTLPLSVLEQYWVNNTFVVRFSWQFIPKDNIQAPLLSLAF